MKIIFFGSTDLGLPILENLMKEHEVSAVVTTPDSKAGRKQEMTETPISTLARKLGLKLLKPQNLRSNQEFFLELQKLAADIFIVVAYGKILPDDYLNLPKHKILNVHPSLLPKYRGPSPIRTALLNGDQGTGASFILLDEQVDHGPILAQYPVAIEPGDNDISLTKKLGEAASAAANAVIQDYVSGKITPLPQDNSRATFTKIIKKEDGKINWNNSSEEIYNQFRAFYPWPGIWTVWNGKKIKILDCGAYPEPRITSGILKNYGTVLDGGIVVCGKGSGLKIKSLQMEGKSEQPITDFLNGRGDFVGSILG